MLPKTPHILRGEKRAYTINVLERIQKYHKGETWKGHT
jgi:hypothetical protein